MKYSTKNNSNIKSYVNLFSSTIDLNIAAKVYSSKANDIIRQMCEPLPQIPYTMSNIP